MAIFKIQLLLNVFQSGSNLLESIHGLLKHWYGWLKMDGGGVPSAIAYNFAGTFKNNITKAEKMLNMSAEQTEPEKIVWSNEFIDEYYKTLCKIEELAELDPKKPMLPQQNENGHGIFFFKDALKLYEEHLECMYFN